MNVASRCGFTPQQGAGTALAGLSRARPGGDRLSCNQFGAQEPGDAAQIRQFCSLDYPVSFPLSEKIEVNGEGADPLWPGCHARSAACLAVPVSWNFSKFLVDRQGRVVSRHAPTTRPEQLRGALERCCRAEPTLGCFPADSESARRASRARARLYRYDGLFLDERALKHVVTRLADARRDLEAAGVEHGAQISQHLRTAADHRTVVFRAQFRQAEGALHLAAFHQRGQAPGWRRARG